ncbi:MAG: lipopolysaccharide heptosyltransferase I [Halioglobus sp.]
MKVLVVKLSSMGDVIHTLPAVSDAAAAIPELSVDWVVEEAFAEIPAWHPAVEQVLPVALRRWRKRPLRSLLGAEWRAARRAIAACDYDAVIDAQGLIKSALVARYARGPRYGMDRHSAREPLAARAYQHPIEVPRDRHAAERLRYLFAAALGYELPQGPGDFALAGNVEPGAILKQTLLFFHGSARAEKLWPVEHWIALAKLATAGRFQVLLPWGDQRERERAEEIARAAGEGVEVLPEQTLAELARHITVAWGYVGVDTGLGHLAAALNLPGVSLYGSTRPGIVGTYGAGQVHLTAAEKRDGDTADIQPDRVWRELYALVTGETD